jgi:site-specific DNA-adenine methylase
MLALDEKKIRKGKPVGLPYVGSKKKISKKIVEIIKQNFGTDKTVYDVFGGGGAITAELMINDIDVVYNDLDKTITDMFNRVLIQDREWIKTLIVSRDEFIEIREKEIKTVDDELKLLVNSFGNNRKDYLYSKQVSDAKYNLAVEILEKEDVLVGYKKTTTYQRAVNLYEDKLGFVDKQEKHRVLQRLQQLQQLQQLERLQQLEQLPKTINKDYKYFSNVKNSILYLDPPYENSDTRKYNSQIDYQEFYDWAYEMSKNNVVLLSSYEVSGDGFECVYEFKNARSTMAGGDRGKRTEKLFMVKG